MTVVARDVQVSAIQREIRLCVVIKQPQVPRDRVVAGTTVILECAVVRVVFKMATDALSIGVWEYLAFVAGITLILVVLTQQREAREVVIEKWHVQPLRLVMTITTLLTQLTAMWLIVQMT